MEILDPDKFHNNLYDKIVYHNIIKDGNVVCSIRKAHTLNINENIKPIEIDHEEWDKFTFLQDVDFKLNEIGK